MATTNLGTVAIHGEGDWSASAAYTKLAIVAYNGGSYMAVQAVPAGTALTDTAYWMPISDTRETFLQALEQHPEWVTTVQDGSITRQKLHQTLAQEIAKHGTDIDVLDSRVDEILGLTPGSTTGDAQLADIKIGWDGSTYATPGDAVRGQVSRLSESTTEIEAVLEIKEPYRKTVSADAIAWEYYAIDDNYEIASGNYYTWNFELPSTRQSKVYVSIRDVDTAENLISTYIPEGELTITRHFLAESAHPHCIVRFRTEENGITSVTFIADDGSASENKIENLDRRVSTLEENPSEQRIINSPVTSYAETLNAGDVISCVGNNAMQGDTISFYGKFNQFVKLTFANGYNFNTGKGYSYRSSWIEVDDVNVTLKYMAATVETVGAVYAHGLTFDEFISVTIKRDSGKTAILTIATKGGLYSTEIDGGWNTATNSYREWNASDGTISAFADMNMTDCKVSFFNQFASKTVWIFGDSYLTYWVPVLNKLNLAKNINADGWPGRRSPQAVESFNVLITKGKPDIILWAMGMNDAENISGRYEEWLTAYNTVKTYCDENKVKFIPFVIPNTTSLNNDRKNAVIRQNERYVDIASAVGAGADGSWYPGLQANDGIHPTTQGAKVIAMRIISDVPELCGY